MMWTCFDIQRADGAFTGKGRNRFVFRFAVGLVVAFAQPGAGQSMQGVSDAGDPEISTEAQLPPHLVRDGSAPPENEMSTETDPTPEPIGAEDATRQVLLQLRGLVLRMEAEIADLKRLRQWQARFIEAARIDPESAYRQRRPMSACHETVLAPWCADLTNLFKPDGAGDTGSSGATDTGIGEETQ